MILRLLALIGLLLYLSPTGHAQVGGTLRGKVTYGGEPAEFATVQLLKDGGFIRGTYTDPTGSYEFVNLPPGAYDVEVFYQGEKKEVRGLKVSSGLETPVPVINLSEDVQFEEIRIEEAIVKADNTTRKVDYDRSSILKVADRSISGVAALGAGVYIPDAGRSANFRGGRSDQSQTFIDGIRIIGNSTMPQIAYDNVAVITGAVPPWYGDFLSGIIDISTADPTVEHKFNFEAQTSQFLDPYGYNLVAGGVGGPIFSKRDSVSGYKKTKLGYFAAVEGEFFKDPSPSYLGIYRVKKDVLKDLEADPLTLNPQGNAFINRATLLTRESWEKSKFRDNAAQRQWTLFGKLQYNLNDNATVRAGASFRNFRGNGSSVTNNFLSPQNNSFTETNNFRGFVRFNQIFTPDSVDNSVLKSLYYFVQADYSLVQGRAYNRDHVDDVFRYGHVGRFTTATAESFRLVTPGEPGHDPRLSANPYYVTASAQPTDTAYYFDPSTSSNPSLAAYNNSIYRVMNSTVRFNPSVAGSAQDFNDFLRTGVFNFLDLFLLNGLPNGFRPRGIYSLWTAQGTPYAGYSKNQSDMIRFTAQATMELGKKGVAGIEAKKRGGLHSIRFGFEFDQRFERQYGLAAVNLWQLMRLQANKHLTNIDSSTASPVFRDGFFQDTVRYSPLYDAQSQSEFDKNLRRKLGYDISDTRFINTDALDPSFYSLDMFSANELLNNGNYNVSYLGYDHLGNIVKRSPAEKFFTDEKNRPQNAFAPTYVSGYIQDKFELDKLYLSLGVRVDRLDLNQPVPKDKYSLYPTYNAREAAQILGVKKPENIDDNWVAYASYRIDSIQGQSGTFAVPDRIIGYRNGDIWYDTTGKPISSSLLRNIAGGTVIPFLKTPPNSPQEKLSMESFEDYKPQVNVMPRVSFSFPITDQANFFAHYDVLTMRPNDGGNQEIGYMRDFLYMEVNPTDNINNPNLRPQRTIDYEVGFQQNLDEAGNLAMIISAYYREMRDMVQITRLENAYPLSYTTFTNLDFATVKGFTFEFVTRRLGPFATRLAYTLQFASGTGSSATSSRNALTGIDGFSVVRNLLPLEFDQRHTLSGNLNFVLDDKYRRGPKIGKVYPFQNLVVSLTFGLGSGTPYTRNALPNRADVEFGVNPTIQTQGQPLSVRLPFNYRVDLRVDKTFRIPLGNAKDGEEVKPFWRKRNLDVAVFLLVPNLFNVRNIFGVYAFSGQPDDSGFLNSPVGQQAIEAEFFKDAYVQQYQAKQEINPGFWGLPRRIRLGVMINF